MDDAGAAEGADARWAELAGDLEGQARAIEAAEHRAAAAELARAELASVSLEDRFGAGVGVEVAVVTLGAGPVVGVVLDVGRGWVLVGDGRRQTLVLLVAVLSVTGLGRHALDSGAAPRASRAAGPGRVLGRHLRDRVAVRLVLVTGEAITGTLDAVGADHVELAVHPADEPRRRGAVLVRRVVPFRALSVVVREVAAAQE